MSWLDQIGGLLQRYTGGGHDYPQGQVYDDFGRCVNCAPQNALAEGIAAAFQSDRTPPFGQMVGQLFGQSDPNQRAGLLNTLLGAVGPQVAAQALSGRGMDWLGSLLGGRGHVTPDIASQIPPDAIQQLAAQAEHQNPSIINTVSNFYAQHPGLVQTLGAGALGAVLSGMARRDHAAPPDVLPASQDPYGDPADQYGGQGVMPASMDPYGDPADQYQGHQVYDASQDPYGDPADEEARR